MAKTENGKQVAAFALNNGLVTHIGSFESVDLAQEAIRAWKEDPQHNRTAFWCYITPVVEAEV